MKKKNPVNLILSILWFTVLIMDIVTMRADAQPNWLNMILAHICLIFAYLNLYLKDNFH